MLNPRDRLVNSPQQPWRIGSQVHTQTPKPNSDLLDRVFKSRHVLDEEGRQVVRFHHDAVTGAASGEPWVGDVCVRARARVCV